MKRFPALLWVIALALAMGASGAALAQNLVAVPPLKGRVTDLTGTLTAQQVATLEQKLAAFEARKGSQIAVLMLPTTRPEEIEQYAMRVADAWKVGRKKVDDGVIIVVAKNDNRVRVEVGYGLEGAIPDVYARRVIREQIAPHFVAGDFYAGLAAGTDQLIKLADGEKLPSPSPQSGSGQSVGQDLQSLLVVLLVIVVVVGAVLTKLLGRFLGSLATGGVAGFVAMALVGTLVAAVSAGALAFILALLLGGSGWRLASGRRGGGWTGGGGWPGGGWGGGSSGGGGWSGGGGGFGGGGASGRW